MPRGRAWPVIWVHWWLKVSVILWTGSWVCEISTVVWDGLGIKYWCHVQTIRKEITYCIELKHQTCRNGFKMIQVRLYDYVVEKPKKCTVIIYLLPGIDKDFAVAPSQPLRAAAPRNRSPPGAQFGSKEFKKMWKCDAQSASSSGGYGDESDPWERSQLSGILSDVLRPCGTWLDDLHIPTGFCIFDWNQSVCHVPAPQLLAIGRRPKWGKNTTINRKRIIMQPSTVLVRAVQFPLITKRPTQCTFVRCNNARPTWLGSTTESDPCLLVTYICIYIYIYT